MSKRARLFAPEIPTGDTPSVLPPAPSDPVVPSRKHTVSKTREGKRTATVFLEPEALQQLKLTAVREDCTVQALLVEGINEVFAKRGLSRIA